MGLLETFQRGALSVMNATGNIPYICIFHKLGYDAEGQASIGDAATIPALRVIRMDYMIEKVDMGAVLMRDRQYLAVALDMGAIEPAEDDTLEFAADDIWTVKRVEIDPAGRNVSDAREEVGDMAEGTLLEFQADLQAFADAVGVTLVLATRKVSLELHNALIERTPFDTGRAKNSWMLSLDTPSEEVLPPGNYSENGATAKAQQRVLRELTESDPYHVVWLSNNLDYIEALNMGHSQQAPAQFVEIALAEMAANIDAIIEQEAARSLPK